MAQKSLAISQKGISVTKPYLCALFAGFLISAIAPCAMADETPVAAPVASTTAAATPAAPAEAMPAAKPKSKGSEVVCKSEDVTGSRLGAHKVCQTRDQWRQESQDQEDAYRAPAMRDNEVNKEGH